MILVAVCVQAQNVPEVIAYQAQLKGSSGQILANALVGAQFNIRETSMSGNIVWQENHVVTLNEFGHGEFAIGTGTSTGTGSLATFDLIDWGGDILFFRIIGR